MANAVYGLARQLFGNGGLNWTGGNIYAGLATSGYSVAINTDQYVGISIGANTVGTPILLAGCTNVLGVLSCNAGTFVSVTSGFTVIAYYVYFFTGNLNTSPIIAYFDTTSSGYVNISTDGSNIPFTPSSGPNGLLKL